MAELHEYKCPCCDGAIEFDIDSQNLKCPYCGTEFPVETIKSYNDILKPDETEMEWDESHGTEWKNDEKDGLLKYVCNSCGGEIITDETTAATSCPYCGNPVTVNGHLSGELRPDIVIPFKFDKKAAIEALKKHYKGKILMPNIFKNENRIKEIKGVYVPFWIFDADADANIRYKATRIRSWSDSRYYYTETSHYSILREGTIGFSNVPVDGSSKIEDKLMQSLEPFDMSQAVDFNTAYLAGFLADKYDVGEKECSECANERIKNTTESTFASTVVGYATSYPVSTSIKLKNTGVKYALLPVWLLNTEWKGKKFTFAMNGQTGKMVGNLPLDWGKFWAWFLGITGAVTLLGTLGMYILWNI